MRPARKGPETWAEIGAGFGRKSASMRPARKGPETGRFRWSRAAPRWSFNEAGPQGAGNDSSRRSAGIASTSLQ